MSPILRKLWVLRWLLIVGPLVLILYYAAGTWLYPFAGIEMWGTTSGRVTVAWVEHPSPAADAGVRVGDVVLTVNGLSLTQEQDWQWPAFSQPIQVYVLQGADGTPHTVALEILPIPLSIWRGRMLPNLIALLAWSVGAVVLLFASQNTPSTWRLSGALIGFGVGLASLAAVASGLPGSRTSTSIILPLVGAAFVELGFMPQAAGPQNKVQSLVSLVYSAAILLSVVALAQIYILGPFEIFLKNFFHFTPLQLILLFTSGGLVANVGILLARYFRTPRSPLKQQLRILVGCSLLGISPLLVFSILPRVLFDVRDLFPAGWDEFFYVPLLLFPLAYIYVIYRHKYLNLDIFFTRTLALFILGFTTLVAYGLFYVLLRRSVQLTSLEPIPSAFFVGAALVGVPAASEKTRQAAKFFLFGSQEAHERILLDLGARLTHIPEVPTLRQAVEEIAGLLEVRKAALWLPDDKGGYQVVGAWHVDDLAPIAQEEVLHRLPTALVIRTSLDEGHLQSAGPVTTPQPLLAQYPWIEVLLPLKTGEDVVGLLALGPRVPDGTFTGFQLVFVQQTANLLAMAAHTTHLFDQVRAQARAMMDLRASERRHVAREIHDGPVQVATSIAFRAEVVADKAHDDDLKRLAMDARQLTHDLRGICSGLRPLEIDLGLASVISSVVQRFEDEQPDIFVETVAAPDLPEVGAHTTEAVYHIVTECLTNIGKYAKAEQVWINLHQDNGHLELEIADDGQGFPQAGLSLPALARNGHFGLVGMYEWAAIAEGRLQFKPRDEGGTVLLFEMPLRAG